MQRELAELGAGRHADPVDQADAILWAASLQARAQILCDQLNRMLLQSVIPGPEAATWIHEADQLLAEVARG